MRPGFLWGEHSSLLAFLSVFADKNFKTNDRKVNHLYTTDLKALNHVMMNSNIYQKPDFFRYYLSEVVGQGLLVVEGDTHKNHVSPAFVVFSPS